MISQTTWFILFGIVLIAALVVWRIIVLRRRLAAERILNYFATSLYGQNTVDDVFWDIAKNCITKLRLEDCVIYLYDEARNVLVQKAAHGPKNPESFQILNPIEIPMGKGIVGSVAQNCRAEIVNNTKKDPRYIVDDSFRYSEMAVPIIIEGKIFGVIDSEHSKKGYFRFYHLKLLSQIAAICEIKLSKFILQERLRVKIARDLHDEIGSTLTSINIMAKMALLRIPSDTVQNEYLLKIREHSNRVMDSMNDIVWAVNPANDTIEKMIIRMKEFAAEILEPAGIHYCFSETELIKDCRLNLDHRNDLYLIYKETIANAVKYSMASSVRIKLDLKPGLLILEITDDGIGFDIDTVRRGNGLKNIQERSKRIKANFQLNSKRGGGTAIHLSVPIPPSGYATNN